MNLIPIDQILIAPDRQRQNFDPDYLNELKESIESEGLFNAVVLREGVEAGAGMHTPRLFLVQGECRLRAIRDIYDLGGEIRYDGQAVPPGMVPYTTLGDLDELARQLAEFHENSHRRNLTWIEEAKATSEIARLRGLIAKRDGLYPPTTAEISEERRGQRGGFSQEKTRQELIVAKHLDKPEVKAAKSLPEAFKALKKAEERERNTKLAETVGRTFSAELHSLVHADSLIWLPEQPAEKWDVICTDPIYGMGADEFGDSGGKAEGAHDYEDSYEAWKDMLAVFAPESFRITKPLAHLYAFCDLDNYHEFRAALRAAGWLVHRTPLIWVKTTGRVPIPDWGPRRQYELILFACKGKRPSTGIYPDVLSYPTDQNLGHQAQKPVALYSDLLRRSCRPGDHVLDCFAGSGTLLPAAHALKCVGTLVEKDTGNYGLMLKRAEGLKDQAELEIEP